jgi:hypothetical protein
MELSSQGSINSKNKIDSRISKRFEYFIKHKEDQFRKLEEVLDEGNFNLNVNIGPNVNLKLPKKSYHTHEEKEFFKNKIRNTKKTELCKNWELYSACYYKDNCSFAHGESELRVKSAVNNQKYKTKKCKVFHEKMYCQFGNRCQYSHVLPMSHLLSYSFLNQQLAASILTEMHKFDDDLDFFKIFETIHMNSNYEVYDKLN